MFGGQVGFLIYNDVDPIWPPQCLTPTTGPHYSRRGDRQAAPQNPLPCFQYQKGKRVSTSEGVCHCLVTSAGVPVRPTMSESVSTCLSMSDGAHEDPSGFLLPLKHPRDPQVSTKTLTHRKQSPCPYHYTTKAH